MKDLLTPKQIARAMNVSESSIKRWCDGGAIATQYTAGGHRKVSIAALLDFARRTKHQVVRPEALGLPSTSGQTDRVVARACEQMTDALVAGEEVRCRQIAVDLYLAGHSVSCDDVLAAAFKQIGERWSCGDAEVYQERRGCVIATHVLQDLRTIIAPPANGAPVAIGGAAEDDQYNLGTSMAELVLRSCDWDARSLGSNLPFDTLAQAIRDHQPKLFWLSCSHVADPDRFIDGYSRLYEEFSLSTAFVVGGYALTDELRDRMNYAAHCDNMKHFEGFAGTLHAALQDG